MREHSSSPSDVVDQPDPPKKTRRGAGAKKRVKHLFDEPNVRRVLHVGCGFNSPERLHKVFGAPWREIRVDIDPRVKPHFVASMTDMSTCIPDASVDAVWSSHSVEHLHSFEVPAAFKEFARVLSPRGFLLINCPDIEQIAEVILSADIDQPVYTSPAGPITPLDIMFGHQKSIRAGNDFMSHRTAFTQKLIATRLLNAGFAEVRVRRGANFDLWCLAMMTQTNLEALLSLMQGAGLDFNEGPTE